MLLGQGATDIFKKSCETLTDRNAENVGLQLHQQPVGGHSSIHLQLSQRNAAVLIHGVKNLRANQKIKKGDSNYFTNKTSRNVSISLPTSRVWKQTASNAANARWLRFVNCVNPQMILSHQKHSD